MTRTRTRFVFSVINPQSERQRGTILASLPGDQRSALLAPYDELDPFHQLSEITETYYAINPHYFAVKSYMHFQKLSDPQAFFRAMLIRPD